MTAYTGQGIPKHRRGDSLPSAQKVTREMSVAAMIDNACEGMDMAERVTVAALVLCVPRDVLAAWMARRDGMK